MTDTTHTIGSTGIAKKLVDLGDGTYADAVSLGARALSTETVVAGAASVLGKIAAPVNAATVYIRCQPSPCHDIDWRVKSDVVHTVQKYRARTIVDSMTVTLASIVDGETATINGVTFTAEDTLAECLRSDYKFYTGGADDTADAIDLAAAINVGKTILCTSVAVSETVLVNGITFTGVTGAGTAAARSFDRSGTDAQTATALAARINHKNTITLTSVVAAQYVTIGGLRFTGGAAQDLPTRVFDRSAGDNAAATSLAACINSATYGVSGVTAAAGTNTVTLTCSAVTPSVTAIPSAGTIVCVPAYGVSGVTATARGKEVSLVNDYASGVTFSAVAGTGITTMVCGDYGIPGVTATPALAVVTIVPKTTAGATCLQSVTGTAAGRWAVAATTLTGLIKDGDVYTDVAANATTAGTLYAQTMNGWEHGYLGITNKSGAGVMTLVVGATPH